MDTATRCTRQQAWDSYWKAGALHSCVGSYGGNYAGSVATFWESRFSALKDGDRILDLATGNGALPQLLLERTGKTLAVQVDAVDIAAISPGWHDPARHSALRFHAGVAMESLPFRDASFDLVISQYGLEYAQWPVALAEALRVCKPRGTAAFVLHHADSVLVQVGRAELANHHVLLADDGLLAAAKDVLPLIARARAGHAMTGDAQAAASRQRYNEAMTAIAGAIESSPVPDLLVQARETIHALLANTTGEWSEALASLGRYRADLEAAALRTGEMIDQALDDGRLAAMRASALDLRPDWILQAEPITQEQGILGWGVVLGPKPSDSD